ncbi:MAG: hypothetical protein Q4G34_02670 [Micrococcus sp.]|nr:hypothetical protein [Micrococcus sp.]
MKKSIKALAATALLSFPLTGFQAADDMPSSAATSSERLDVEAAASLGVTPGSYEVEVQQDGARFIYVEDNEWIFQIPDSDVISANNVSRLSDDQLLPANWSAGVCRGSFTELKKVQGGMQWGHPVAALRQVQLASTRTILVRR